MCKKLHVVKSLGVDYLNSQEAITMLCVFGLVVLVGAFCTSLIFHVIKISSNYCLNVERLITINSEVFDFVFHHMC